MFMILSSCGRRGAVAQQCLRGLRELADEENGVVGTALPHRVDEGFERGDPEQFRRDRECAVLEFDENVELARDHVLGSLLQGVQEPPVQQFFLDPGHDPFDVGEKVVERHFLAVIRGRRLGSEVGHDFPQWI
jgi:hypothetical protein